MIEPPSCFMVGTRHLALNTSPTLWRMIITKNVQKNLCKIIKNKMFLLDIFIYIFGNKKYTHFILYVDRIHV